MPRLVPCLVLLTLAGRVGGADPERASVEFFESQVRPLLTEHCIKCHGPDRQKGGLRLDSRASVLAGGMSGPALVPGKPEGSRLLRAVHYTGELRMPPQGKLTTDQLAILTKWVEGGAAWSEAGVTTTSNWSFRPIQRPALPKVGKQDWPQSPVDHFILARLEAKGLRPAAPADKRTLIRRASFDLTGLPPTPEEIEAFLTDDSPTAFAKLVDRLLASPHYGERWGRHWLDVARYADSGGFETDILYGSAWRYRDYVIRSFNADKPFDRFIKEQLAGDELFPGDREALVATGLYAVGPVLQEAGMVPGKLDYDWLTDAVDTTGAAFLGLTVGCARCHDHKYDPIAQQDYFALQALFAGSDLFDYKSDGSVLKEHVALRKTEAEFEAARKRTTSPKKPGDFDEYPEIPLRGLGHRTKPLEVRLLTRGELGAPRDVVNPGLPKKLASGITLDGVPREKWRTRLAEWLTSRDNPLTARVFVNRVWQWHFGEGLVRTSDDFGARGERPIQPDLLDWLANEFVSHGWSLKHLHRVILLSSTYQMSSAAESNSRETDLQSHFSPRRVEAEVVWDAIRSVAGTLDRRVYGLPVLPPLDERERIGNYKKWPAGPATDANRRALYVLNRRSFRFPPLGAFDPPENVTSCARRDRTIVPNQALTLMNNRMVREQALAFAERLLRETDGQPASIAASAWLLAYGRPIGNGERREALAFLGDREKAAPVADARKHAITELCAALFTTNEFIYLP